MSHLKRVQENLQELDEQESKNLKQQYENLKVKMAAIETKRNKTIQDRVKLYKQNDERWFHKLKEIQQRFRQQNREAMDKARKYREESENYWKNKEKKMQERAKNIEEQSRTTMARRHDYADPAYLHRSFIEGSNAKYQNV